MRKPAFCIFCGLCILTLFFLLTVNMRGVSNKHCLLPFFHLFTLSARHNSGELCCHATALVRHLICVK